MSRKKRIKMFKYLKDKIGNNGIVFLQETHSSEDTYNEWRDDFKGRIFFSHGMQSSCGVMIGFLGSITFLPKSICKDKNGRILIIEAEIDDETFILINFYNSNTETEQVKSINDLENLLQNFEINPYKNIVFAGDFNLFFDRNLEACGGTPSLKKKSVSKIIQLLEKYNLSDIWRIRNPTSNRYTYRKNHFSGYIQRRLDFIFFSNNLQDSIQKIDILPSFCSDHSPIVASYVKYSFSNFGNNFWKFNSSLINDELFVAQMKEYIKNKLLLFQNEDLNNQSKLEYLKYEIRKFTINFSKNKAKNKRKEKAFLENKINKLEQVLDDNNNNKIDYEICKGKLNKIYDDISNGIQIRSKFIWYEYGEKSSKFFLNLEKHRAAQNTVKKILNRNDLEITNFEKVNKELLYFYENLFKKKNTCTKEKLEQFLNSISLPTLINDEKLICEGEITEKELFISLSKMENNKSPGNDGLTKEFYVTFWSELKDTFILSLKESKKLQKLGISQRQAIIRLIEKPNRDRRFIKNWRPISLLNVDQKILSKTLAGRLKEILPKLKSPGQTAYVENRFIGESGRLIADILETCDREKLEGLLLAIDIEKAFDSLEHDFLIAVLEKYGFGGEFLNWIKILLNDQQSCVVNGGHTTRHFKLERRTRQGDPISAYLFILALKVFFYTGQIRQKCSWTVYFLNTNFFILHMQTTRHFS